MHKQGCTLLISTYNWPQALQICLLSVLQQTVMPNEIVIADDGSTNDTKALIDEYRTKTTIPIKHIWHKDEGFRKTIILNEAIRNSTQPYIIQIDGDIIIHPKFIQEHLLYAQQGFFIRGSRILLDEKNTQNYITKQKTNLHFLSSGVQHRFNAVHSTILSKIVFAFSDKQNPNNVIGCNMSFFKKDFIAVNGYNNDITGWGREDGELAARFINSGILKKQVKNKAIAFHMFHGHFSRDRDEINMQILKQAIASKIKTCTNGYSTTHDVLVYS
ncbi:MAG: glycosyltransferase family 2 protein [Ferruginibacter sp.]|nr:glycosyltransferase family 2 protein [Ferruginibacter sp.]